MRRQFTFQYLLIRTSNMKQFLRNLYTHHLIFTTVNKKTDNKVTKNEYFTMGHTIKTEVKEKGKGH